MSLGIIGLLQRRRQGQIFVGAYDAIPSIVAAYGMRRLRTSYAGSLLRIRRSADNTEQDIGYTGAGHLDTAAVAAFVGGGSGYIVTWYDQSGNGYNATQTTAASQPLYVASGQNGRPVARLDGTDDFLQVATTTLGLVRAGMLLAVIRKAGTFSADEPIFGFAENTRRLGFFVTGGGNMRFHPADNVGENEIEHAKTNYESQTTSVAGVFANGSAALYRNGASVGTATPSVTSDYPSNTFYVGRMIGLTTRLNGDITELIICNAALSAGNRQLAEQAANSYWAVYA